MIYPPCFAFTLLFQTPAVLLPPSCSLFQVHPNASNSIHLAIPSTQLFAHPSLLLPLCSPTLPCFHSWPVSRIRKGQWQQSGMGRWRLVFPVNSKSLAGPGAPRRSRVLLEPRGRWTLGGKGIYKIEDYMVFEVNAERLRLRIYFSTQCNDCSFFRLLDQFIEGNNWSLNVGGFVSGTKDQCFLLKKLFILVTHMLGKELIANVSLSKEMSVKNDAILTQFMDRKIHHQTTDIQKRCPLSKKNNNWRQIILVLACTVDTFSW